MAHPIPTHQISIVIPVYAGALTLPDLMAEIAPLTQGFVTPAGYHARISEVLLVHDRGPDASDAVMRRLQQQFPFVRAIWLSRNYGQHAATLAGMASSGGDWIATIDEDGQYEPAQIATMLDVAMRDHASVVYAGPVNAAPHGPFRNWTSQSSKRFIDVMTGSNQARYYHSFRLVLGEIGRAVAAYSGAGVYLDVALGWMAGDVVTAPVRLRDEGRRSGYSLPKLISHFWKMTLTSGTRGLRVVSFVGAISALLGLIMAIFTIVDRFRDSALVPGWASLMTVSLLASGVILLFLGIIAEYIGVAVTQAMGKPPYLIVSDFKNGPLGYPNEAEAARLETDASGAGTEPLL